MDEEEYRATKADLKALMVGYFNAYELCNSKLGTAISPTGSTATGGKILKVRWALPGRGKRGGPRIAVVAHCEEKRVVIAEAWPQEHAFG